MTMMTKTRQTIAFLLLTISCMAMLGYARISTAIEVPVVTDLSQVAKQANKHNLPVLLVFSADHCPYCEMLEDEILKPMLINGEYRKKVLIVKVMLDDYSDLVGFDGKAISTMELSQRYNAYVTPTMLFLDSQGDELSERILGINTLEMFGGRVDDAINTALAKLRMRKKLARNNKGLQ